MFFLDIFMFVFQYGFFIIFPITLFLLILYFIFKFNKKLKIKKVINRITKVIMIFNLSFLIIGTLTYYLRPYKVDQKLSEETITSLQQLSGFNKEQIIGSLLKMDDTWSEFDNGAYINDYSMIFSCNELDATDETSIDDADKKIIFESEDLKIYISPIIIEPTSFLIPVEPEYCYCEVTIETKNIILSFYERDFYASKIDTPKYIEKWSRNLE